MKKYLFFGLMVFLASCEYESVLTYKVRNSTGSTIKVVSKNTEKSSQDTIFVVPNGEAVVGVFTYGVSSVKKHKESDGNLKNFSQMDIFIQDTTPSVTKFLETNRWIFNLKRKNQATHSLTVYASDF